MLEGLNDSETGTVTERSRMLHPTSTTAGLLMYFTPKSHQYHSASRWRKCLFAMLYQFCCPAAVYVTHFGPVTIECHVLEFLQSSCCYTMPPALSYHCLSVISVRDPCPSATISCAVSPAESFKHFGRERINVHPEQTGSETFCVFFVINTLIGA